MTRLKVSEAITQKVELLERSLGEIENENQDFCLSMIAFHQKSGGLTHGQEQWVDELLRRIEQRRQPGATQECYVYFIAAINGIKIGLANDPESRLSTLQVGNIQQLDLLQTIRCGSREEAQKLEKMLHGAFREKRIRGEWFDYSIVDDFAKDPVSYSSTEGLRRLKKRKALLNGPAQILEFPTRSSLVAPIEKSKTEKESVSD